MNNFPNFLFISDVKKYKKLKVKSFTKHSIFITFGLIFKTHIEEIFKFYTYHIIRTVQFWKCQ